MMEGYVMLVYNNQDLRLVQIPSNYSQLTAMISSQFKVEKRQIFIYIENIHGAKTVVKTQRTYHRLLTTSNIKKILVETPQQNGNSESIDLTQPELLIKHRKKRQRNTLETEEIPKEEECSVCYLRFRLPMKAKCGHVLCKACWAKTLAQHLECPICRGRVRMKHLRPYTILNEC